MSEEQKKTYKVSVEVSESEIDRALQGSMHSIYKIMLKVVEKAKKQGYVEK